MNNYFKFTEEVELIESLLDIPEGSDLIIDEATPVQQEEKELPAKWNISKNEIIAPQFHGESQIHNSDAATVPEFLNLFFTPHIIKFFVSTINQRIKQEYLSKNEIDSINEDDRLAYQKKYTNAPEFSCYISIILYTGVVKINGFCSYFDTESIFHQPFVSKTMTKSR